MSADWKPVVTPRFWRGVRHGLPISLALWALIGAVLFWFL